MHTDYDANSRVADVKLDSQTVAIPAYDTFGRLNTVSYPSGTGNGGNGTSLAPIVRDALGRTTGLTWKDPSSAPITSDAVTRSLGGDVTDETIDGTDADPANPNFVYDNAGRLTSVKVAGHTYTYGFGTSSGCAAGAVTTAGENSDRTSVTDNAVTANSCYDAADRLISTDTSGYGNLAYDSHGNTTTLGTETLGYDDLNRHVTSTGVSTSVRYTRDATGTIVARTVTPATSTGTVGFRASSSATTASGTTVTVNAPSGTTAGDVLVAAIAYCGRQDGEWCAVGVDADRQRRQCEWHEGHDDFVLAQVRVG